MEIRGANIVRTAIVLGLVFLPAAGARAHCDTMDGPVVTDARAALEKGDPAPIVKWVKPDHEKEIRAAFDHAVAVRKLSPEAKTMADQYFYETLVRVHRAGEGAPYTGLKPAGTPVEPGIAAADKALESGQVDPLAKKASEEIATAIRIRFARAQAAKEHADHNPAAGREYVAAYVEFTHFMERLHAAIHSPVAHGEGTAATEAHGHE